MLKVSQEVAPEVGQTYDIVEYARVIAAPLRSTDQHG
jgi:hypothetical protein